MSRFSTRIGDHWLVLTHLHDSTWHLQVLGDTPLEAEVTAVDEEEAKSCAVTATLERLSIGSCQRIPSWNAVITGRWDSRDRV
jgi:hypothetical protein